MGSSKSKPVEIDDEEAIKVIKDIDVNTISEMSRIDILQINSLKAIINKLEKVNECKKDKIYYKLPASRFAREALLQLRPETRTKSSMCAG